jgi:hypothetical protein
MKYHLPEASGEVDGGENTTAGFSDLSNTFRYVKHGVLINQSLIVERPEILYNA